MANSNLHIRVAVRLLLLVPFAAALLFLPAGTLDYWQAWIFVVVFFICNVALTVYLAVKDPRLLQRRMKGGPAAEKSAAQKIIVTIIFTLSAGAALVPALDRRFGWSTVPTSVVILGDILIAVSYYGFYRVLRANTYGAATVQVEEGQKVISNRPYGVIRHPMYSVALILFLGISLALGSWWGLLILAAMIPVLTWRLLDEEEFLRRNLSGYSEYTRKVRYRLLPGVW